LNRSHQFCVLQPKYFEPQTDVDVTDWVNVLIAAEGDWKKEKEVECCPTDLFSVPHILI